MNVMVKNIFGVFFMPHSVVEESPSRRGTEVNPAKLNRRRFLIM
jgi:hypothetical protein